MFATGEEEVDINNAGSAGQAGEAGTGLGPYGR